MNTPVALVLLASLLVPFAPQSTRLAEPPQEFFLQCGTKELDLRLGQSVELPKDCAGQKATLRLRPTRHFQYQGLRFQYPQDHAWLFEPRDDGSSLVTLSGRQTALRLHVFEDKRDPAAAARALAEATAEQWGAKAMRREYDLKGKGELNSLVGWRVQGVVDRDDLVHEFYGVALGAQTGVLVLEDLLTEAGESDPETKTVKELLAQSLELPR